MKPQVIATTCLGLTLLTLNTGAESSWPRFRGATANGSVADDPRLPVRWSETENVLWKTEIRGLGWSSPVVTGNRVFLTGVYSEEDSANEQPKAGLYLGRGRQEIPKGTHHWLTYAVDLQTGKIAWQKEAHQGRPAVGRHPKNTYASETPATDGERLFVLFGDLGLYCYDLEGGLVWSNTIDPKQTLYDYGAAGSPIVHDGQVIVLYDNQETSYIASYDARTGTETWRQPREEKSTWATPFIWEHDQRTEIITSGKQRIRSYDLKGSVLWEMDGRMSNLIIPSPFASHGMLYVTSGYFADSHRPVYAIKPGANGDITLKEGETTNQFIAWYLPRGGPYNTSPLVHGDVYYTLLDRGMMSANDARTGEELYDRERFPVGASFTASPWAYNGRVFCLNEAGQTYVLTAGRKFNLEHTNDLDGLCLATPAIVDGKLLIRTATQLYCLTEMVR
ncbi:MAG TPA: serine/threonine protein kinase [Verrucomicrobiales bacterium]|nr:serine/threonine protein kinase [Verrucomicrobiales bacterium]